MFSISIAIVRDLSPCNHSSQPPSYRRHTTAEKSQAPPSAPVRFFTFLGAAFLGRFARLGLPMNLSTLSDERLYWAGALSCRLGQLQLERAIVELVPGLGHAEVQSKEVPAHLRREDGLDNLGNWVGRMSRLVGN